MLIDWYRCKYDSRVIVYRCLYTPDLFGYCEKREGLYWWKLNTTHNRTLSSGVSVLFREAKAACAAAYAQQVEFGYQTA